MNNDKKKEIIQEIPLTSVQILEMSSISVSSKKYHRANNFVPKMPSPLGFRPFCAVFVRWHFLELTLVNGISSTWTLVDGIFLDYLKKKMSLE